MAHLPVGSQSNDADGQGSVMPGALSGPWQHWLPAHISPRPAGGAGHCTPAPTAQYALPSLCPPSQRALRASS
eukprot:CAMPEP_0179100150 /NCGR_PEP_ID=MMETSP0796-20121207/46236_1 /TAXON_ID=73915 /ORGANISM="Pyrodinium bahamense, Strain pbaha01" /LENGTH=72 /DNA_ID=CAMNT_0020797961 /DNA_START=356 /DNA_END=574 /DNA_ORIENTATION=+